MAVNAVLTGLAWFMKADFTEVQLQILRAKYSYEHPHEGSVFTTYVELDDRIGVPQGDKNKLELLIPWAEYEDKRITPLVDKPINLIGLALRPYQDDAMKEVLRFFHNGGTTFNLAGKAGSGKSVLIAGILAELGVKTLIIAHLSMLTEQLAKEIGTFTDADVSILNAKNTELQDVNIATSQFISKRPELWKDIKHTIGCIIVDESETSASLTTLRILQRAHARYRIFVSATFSRSTDNRTEALIDVAGKKIITLERPDLIVPNIMMVKCDERYPTFIHKNRFVKDKHRFFRQASILEKVLFLAEKSLAKGRYIFIATDIIEMQELIHQKLGAGVLNGSTKKKDRDRILEEFNSGKLKSIVGAAVLTAGVSIPRVSTIIRVSFPGSPEKNVQLVGRSLRDFEGKEGAWIFDMVFGGQDPSKRIKAYKENGYKVTRHTWDVLKDKL